MNPKSRNLLIVVVLVLFIGAGVPLGMWMTLPNHPEVWDELHLGMTDEESLNLLRDSHDDMISGSGLVMLYQRFKYLWTDYDWVIGLGFNDDRKLIRALGYTRNDISPLLDQTWELK